MLVLDAPAAVNNWVAERGGGRCPPGTFTALGYVSRGELVGGLVFYASNGVNCFVNIALEGGTFPKSLLEAGFYYTFKQLTLRRLSFWISCGNMRSIALARGLGAVHEGTMKGAGEKGEDVEMYALFPEKCKLWRRVNEKRFCAGKSESRGDDSPSREREPEDCAIHD